MYIKDRLIPGLFALQILIVVISVFPHIEGISESIRLRAIFLFSAISLGSLLSSAYESYRSKKRN